MDIWVWVGSLGYRLSWQQMFLVVLAEVAADFIVASEEPCYCWRHWCFLQIQRSCVYAVVGW